MISSSNDSQQIPEAFFAFETKKPFTHCIECEKILDDETDYVIEKAMRRYDNYAATDTIIDYAMCTQCAMKMRDELSKESLSSMDRFFNAAMQKVVSQSDRSNSAISDEQGMRCIVTGKRIEECQEYQIYAHCRGSSLSGMIKPYMISSEAVDQLLPLLSTSTTDFLNGFFDKHFKPDPSLMEPVGPRLILI
jgi:hypothetical protein